MTEEVSVLNFIEHLPLKPPKILTVERTTQSKYQFHLLARAVRKKIRARPVYLQNEKQRGFQDQARAILEEHSFLQDPAFPDRLYVMEGFAGSWIETLALPKNTYVVAETDGGKLKAEPYAYRKRRDILKVLLYLLGMQLSLRELLKFDWTALQRYEDYEPFLLKAQIMGWDETAVGEVLGSFERGNILTQIKRSDFKPIMDLLDRRGHLSVYTILMQSLAELMHYRSLRLMGFDEIRTRRELELREWRGSELEDAMKMLTGEDIHQMAERIVSMDRLVLKLGTLGLQVLILNAPIRVKK